MTKGKVLKAIRSFCMECMCGVFKEIENCTAPKCPLFELRRGVDPTPSKKGFGSRPHVGKKVKDETSV